MNPDDIKAALEQAYTGGFESLVSAVPGQDRISGQFFDRGVVYDYTISQSGIQFQENRSDSEYVADYFQGRLDAMGIRCDSDNPYEYWKGRTQQNLDSAPLNCKNGTPCGGRCLPRGQKCQIEGGGIKQHLSRALKGAGKVAAEAGDFVFGNPWTDVRQAQSGQISGRRALIRNLIKAGVVAGSVAASKAAADKAFGGGGWQ